MSPSSILHQSTKSIFVAYSERELTFEVNLPTNLGELTFKNTSKWVIDRSGVVVGGHAGFVRNAPFLRVTGVPRS